MHLYGCVFFSILQRTSGSEEKEKVLPKKEEILPTESLKAKKKEIAHPLLTHRLDIEATFIKGKQHVSAQQTMLHWRQG